MFDTVRGQTRVAAGRLGTGAGVSIFFHAALFAVAIILGAQHPDVIPVPDRVVVFPPRASLGTPDAPARPAGPSNAAATPRRTPQVAPPATITPAPLTLDTVAPPDVAPDVVGTELTGDGSRLGRPDGDPTAAPSANPGVGDVVLDYDAHMTAPRMLSGRPPEYTPQALAARVEGTMLVRCVITSAGAVRDCRAIQSLPHLEASVIRALESRRYAPVTVGGEPVSVNYVFRIRLRLP